jgi:hypothetical protein
MSRIALTGNENGSGTFTVAAPDSNTNRLLNLPDASGEVVTDSAAQTLTNKTIQGGALTLATAVTASGTSVNFTGIPSWVKRITVMFSGVSTNGTSSPQIQLGTGSTTYVTSGYLGSCISTNASPAATTISAGFVFGFSGSGAATSIRHGSVVLTKINENTWVATGNVGSSELAVVAILGGSVNLESVLTAVRITMANGTDTFDAGTINIMYEG